MKRERKADALVKRTRHLFAESLVGGYEAKAAWDAVAELRRRGNWLTFERARVWCGSEDALRRARGAAILCQLRQPRRNKPWGDPLFAAKSCDLILSMVGRELSEMALGSQIAALGHLGDSRAIAILLLFVGHPSADVRFDLAYALGQLANDANAIPALQRLMEDEAKDVRNWAIFGLGSLCTADSFELREGFLAHLTDPYFDARLEAIEALAQRQDRRVVPALIKALQQYGLIWSLSNATDHLLDLSEKASLWKARDYIMALKSAFPDGAGQL